MSKNGKKKNGAKEVEVSARQQHIATLSGAIISPAKCSMLLKTLAKKNGGELPAILTRNQTLKVALGGKEYAFHGVTSLMGIAYRGAVPAAARGKVLNAWDRTMVPLMRRAGYKIVGTDNLLRAKVVKVPKRKAVKANGAK